MRCVAFMSLIENFLNVAVIVSGLCPSDNAKRDDQKRSSQITQQTTKTVNFAVYKQ